MDLLSGRVDTNHGELVTFLGKQRAATIQSRCRSVVLRMQNRCCALAFEAWVDDTNRAGLKKMHGKIDGAQARIDDVHGKIADVKTEIVGHTGCVYN